MKSAYELAMEKLGDVKSYTEAEKEALAEIGRKYEAKRAQLTMGGEDRVKDAAGDAFKIDEIRDEISRDLVKLQEKEEREKADIRNEGS